MSVLCVCISVCILHRLHSLSSYISNTVWRDFTVRICFFFWRATRTLYTFILNQRFKSFKWDLIGRKKERSARSFHNVVAVIISHEITLKALWEAAPDGFKLITLFVLTGSWSGHVEKAPLKCLKFGSVTLRLVLPQCCWCNCGQGYCRKHAGAVLDSPPFIVDWLESNP